MTSALHHEKQKSIELTSVFCGHYLDQYFFGYICRNFRI